MKCQNKINLGQGEVDCDHSALPETWPPMCGCCVLIGPLLDEVRAATDHIIRHAIKRGETEGIIAIGVRRPAPAMHTAN